ncbi:MAG TPA: transglycosylase SLT domain-containing protein [Pyrinomonadaceae bacterium]
MKQTHACWRAVLLSCATLLLGSHVAPLHAQQRAGAPVTVRPAKLPRAQPFREHGARPQSSAQRVVLVRVRAGDTLAGLASRFKVTPEEVARLNNVSVEARLRPGYEIKVPFPSSDEPAGASPEATTARKGGKALSFVDGTSVEVDDAWEDAQGVWIRRGGITNLIERSRVRSIEGGDDAAGSEANTTPAPKVKIVEISAAAQPGAQAEPVWIYLVGGARVEADEVTETASGAWYRRGILSIFLERARIERIERERPQLATATGGKRSWTERGWSTGNAHIDALIKQNGARYGVDPYLIFCVMEQESHFNARVVSPKGARGLMQLMPGTGARFGVRKPFDPAENIMGGTRYLKLLLDSFDGRVDLVLASYNAGEGAVMKYGGRVPPYRETRDYVKRISARYEKNRPAAGAAAHTQAGTVAKAAGLK